MVDRQQIGWRRRLSVYSSGWVGVALAGVAVHFVAAVCRALRFRTDFPFWNYIQPSDYIVTGIFLLCVVGYYSRLRRLSLGIWFIIALFCMFVSYSDQWGETLLHGDEAQKRQFQDFAFLASGLFALGSLILLISSVALIWAEVEQFLRKRAEADFER